MTTVRDYEIDVAISHAGEDSIQARALAEALKRRNGVTQIIRDNLCDQHENKSFLSAAK